MDIIIEITHRGIHHMSDGKKINNNSIGTEITEETHVRVPKLLEILGVGKSAYYEDLKFLGIKTIKDNDGCSWITIEELEQVKQLRKHVENTGARKGFQSEITTDITLRNDNNIVVDNNKNNRYIEKQEIYVEPKDEVESMDYGEIIREAQELKARELALKNLVVRAMADDLQEEELDQDLREAVENSRRAVNPKSTPKEIGNLILMKYRGK